MQFKFEAQITRLEGKIKWLVFYFPHSAEEHFGSKGNIPVKITVDGIEFDHMLQPSKNGHYMVYNEFIKRAAGKGIGDKIHVTLEKDDTPRTIKVPKDIEEALNTAALLEAFLKQPDYIKREQINYIEIAKKEETRTNRITALLTKVK